MKKITFNFTKSLICVTILALTLVIAQSIIQNGIDFTAYLFQITHPLILLLNFLPIFLFMSLFFFITNSLWKSYLITAIPVTVLLIINHYKTYFLDAPLSSRDIAQAFEAVSIAQNYTLTFSPKIFTICLLLFAIIVFLMQKTTNTEITTKQKLISFATIFIVFILSFTLIYKNTYIYENVCVTDNIFYDVDIVNNKGLIYSLLAKTSLDTTYNPPDGYSSEAVQTILTDYDAKNKTTQTPNIIAIMSEAFFDPQSATNIEFYKNPLPNFNRLRKTGYYGNIVVPGFAGSTALTEFEFLTGMSTYSIDSSIPNIYKTHITQPINSIVSLFKNLDYTTLAIHPGDSWFYNRKNVYEYMGFDNAIFKSDLPENQPQTNYYINDSVTSALIIENYKKHLENTPDKNYFNFTVTIQNHGPYMDYETEREAILKRPENVSDELYNVLNNYMIGLSDADKLLGDVADYIDTLDTPTVLVFFGDHLPYFDSELLGYDAIGYDITSPNLEALKRKYSTPYIIYGNNAFRTKNTLSGYAGDISANYLASELLDYINISTPFFNFTKMLRNQINIIAPNYFYTNNLPTTELTQDKMSLLQQYKILEYYNLKETKIQSNTY